MRNAILIILLIFSISCENHDRRVDNFQNFIDVDVNSDYNGYFGKLSNIYLEVLKDDYKTQSIDIVFDSIVKSRQDLKDSIRLGVFRLKNNFVDSIESKEKGVRILKYRNSIFDIKNQSELFKEKFVIEVIENQEKKYIPYNPMSLPQIDSVISIKFSPILIEELSQALTFKEHTENNPIFKKTEKRFKEYISHLENDNSLFLNFIYPPIFQSLLASTDQTQFTEEQKRQLLEYFRQGMETQKLDFKRYLIAGFKKTKCSEKEAYLLDYAIDVGKNVYIPGTAIIIHENNEIYFIEFDYEELKNNYSDVFSATFINCLKSSSEL